MIKSAMTTQVLFKPTLEEGSFVWERASLEAIKRLPAGKQGDVSERMKDDSAERMQAYIDGIRQA